VPLFKPKKYQDVFGQWLCDMAAADSTLVGITPAMCEGSGMVKFAEQFPNRYYDVAIAEQHAVTLAAGLACENYKPVVAIYSTFLQRAYDQLIHDVAIQNLDVTFAIDRAGIVGEDGATHAGNFDLSYMRCIPNLVIAAPSDENECRALLTTAYQYQGPAAVRYPRGVGTGVAIDTALQTLPIGQARPIREGKSVAILNFGTLLPLALSVAELVNAHVYDMRFVKPLDTEVVEQLATQCDLLVTLEDNTVLGGAGCGVNEYLAQVGIHTPIMIFGLPDKVVEHGSREQILEKIGLTPENLRRAIHTKLHQITGANQAAL